MIKYTFVLMILLVTVSCKNDDRSKSIVGEVAIQVDSHPGECPYLCKDQQEQTVLSWVRMINDSTTAFCYAIYKNGRIVDPPIIIPGTGNIQPHGENLPKLIFKPSGEILALWGENNSNPNNKYSGLVFYAQSFDKGKSWTNPRPLVTDTAGYDQRYFDVALLPNGEAGIIWLDNRKTVAGEGSALYFATTNGKNGFGNGKLIAQTCCECCRTDLFVDTKAGIHALYRGIIDDSIRDMVHIVSDDGGKTFSSSKRISNDNWVINGCPHTGPAMTENRNGLHFAWFTGGNNRGCYYTQSIDNGKSFSAREGISSQGSHPQLTSLANGDILIVWDESYVADNRGYKRIGIQRRNADGKEEGKNFIANDKSFASYPVISALDDYSAIVVYTEKESERSFVKYEVVELNSESDSYRIKIQK